MCDAREIFGRLNIQTCLWSKSCSVTETEASRFQAVLTSLDLDFKFDSANWVKSGYRVIFPGWVQVSTTT